MNVRFDPVADAAYFRFNNSKIIESEEVSPGIVYDFDQDNQVVGIEILKVKYRTPEQLKELSAKPNSPLSSEHRNFLRDFFKLQKHSL